MFDPRLIAAAILWIAVYGHFFGQAYRFVYEEAPSLRLRLALLYAGLLALLACALIALFLFAAIEVCSGLFANTWWWP